MKCTQHNENQAKKLLDYATDLYNTKQYGEAIKIFEHLLKSHTDAIEEWNIKEFLGLCHYYLENYDDAERYLKSAASLIDGTKGNELQKLIIHNNIGSTYIKKDDWPRALKYFINAEKYINMYEGEKWAYARYLFYLEKGRCYYQIGEFHNAYTSFQLAYDEIMELKKYSDVSESESYIKLELACTLNHLKSFKNARDFLHQVDPNKLDPLSKVIYSYELFQLHVISSDYKSALREFKNVESQGMKGIDKAEAYYILGILYFRHGIPDKARESFNKSLSIKTEYDWIHEGAKAYLNDLEAAN